MEEERDRQGSGTKRDSTCASRLTSPLKGQKNKTKKKTTSTTVLWRPFSRFFAFSLAPELGNVICFLLFIYSMSYYCSLFSFILLKDKAQVAKEKIFFIFLSNKKRLPPPFFTRPRFVGFFLRTADNPIERQRRRTCVGVDDR